MERDECKIKSMLRENAEIRDKFLVLKRRAKNL
jgi:hypothetical protein